MQRTLRLLACQESIGIEETRSFIFTPTSHSQPHLQMFDSTKDPGCWGIRLSGGDAERGNNGLGGDGRGDVGGKRRGWGGLIKEDI